MIVYRFDNDDPPPWWGTVLAWSSLLALVVAFFHYCARAPMAKIADALKDAQRTQGAK
mgnify:FL=1